VKIPAVSVIVPTYREVENLPLLIERLETLLKEDGFDLELLIMDDDSQDGTETLIERLDRPWIRLIVRKQERGLSEAVCEGLRNARGRFLVVMDADLSHPPEAIPRLIGKLNDGADFVIGSRYVAGASVDASWSALRWLNSRVATLLARPFTRASDPMSGFFALHRSTYERGAGLLNPVGYKIGLELIVKCNCRSVAEVPIHFADRRLGESKLTLTTQLRYIRHLRRLAVHKFGNWARLAQFLIVGGLGTVVNMAVLTIALILGAGVNLALALGIAVSLVFNFLLNRRFTFSYASRRPMLTQFFGFAAACSLGAAVNYVFALATLHVFPATYPQIASLIGIAAGSILNFMTNRYAVFRDHAPLTPPRSPR
jgi:dolichol-phosphate mannosyltransferase